MDVWLTSDKYTVWADTDGIVWQAGCEASTSDKPLQSFGFAADDPYTQGVHLDRISLIIVIVIIILKSLDLNGTVTNSCGGTLHN